ncbi:MAG: nicotinate phosphoribosyltransferase [Candidatus Latescibacteria bacterium]|nr:nicotinate phosphoribosyltransferase [Candidatus Latescibacterota bacterium]
MAYGYWKSGVENKESVFNLFFRGNPFDGGYCVSCGLSYILDMLEHIHFEKDDIEYLRNLRGNDDNRIFDDAFLEYISELEFSCDIDAVPEGTVVFPFEPLVRVKGPIIQCQIFETLLLNIVNFQTLIATKAARICDAAQGDPVLDFGLRRAQGFDGAITASRAAYIGGCIGTSNVLAGKLFNIPVKGTHAHSWVMSFDEELESFMAYAHAMPNNCIILVDTYDTIAGVRKAIETGKWLNSHGHELAGIRLDSGDLLSLSKTARKMLDDAGFNSTSIVGSNELDEYSIERLKKNGAPITVWGVGTKLITAYDHPALGGVYKLTAVRDMGEDWQYKIKLSDDKLKISTPGILQIRRYSSNSIFQSDVLYDIELGFDNSSGSGRVENECEKLIFGCDEYENLLVPCFRHGKPVYVSPSLSEIRDRVKNQLSRLPDKYKRLDHPARFPVCLEPGLSGLKEKLIEEARRKL